MVSTLPACLQPRLGLEVMGSVPAGCFGFLVEDDHSDPILSEGEFAIIDTNMREPESASLFLIEWSTGKREIVETYQRPCSQGDGIETLHWCTAHYNRPRSREELDRAIRKGGCISTVDGPYAEPEYLAEKLIGKVVGVLARDRHTRDELMRIRDVARCPARILATDYGKQPAGYIAPAGSRAYRRGAA